MNASAPARFARSTEMTLLVVGALGSAALVAGSHGSLLHGKIIADRKYIKTGTYEAAEPRRAD